MAATAHEALSTFVEAVIFCHSEQESTSGKFVGSKERVRIGLKSSHKSLNAFRNHVTTFCGIKDECVKRGLGESFDVKFCRLVKDGTSQPKAFSINTQEQWEVEKQSVLQNGTNVTFLTFIRLLILRIVKT